MKQNVCCRLVGVIFISMLVVAAGGLFLWQFLPEDQKAAVRDNVDLTEGLGGLGGGGGSGGVNGTNNNMADDDQVFIPAYTFDQCRASAASCCNGLETICDIPANEIMYATAHNAFASANDGFRFAGNHIYSLEHALEAGFRGLSLDVGRCGNTLSLVHNRCALGTRDVVEVFAGIHEFLNEHPRDVLVINIQINNDLDGPVDYDELYDIWSTQVPGLVQRFYQHPQKGDPWPTLRSLIAADRRILLFVFNGAPCRDVLPVATTTTTTTAVETDPNTDTAAPDAVTCPPGFMNWFDYTLETQFNFKSVAEIQDPMNSCVVTRGGSGTLDFFGVNVFVTLPKRAAAAELNQVDFLRDHVATCSDLNGGLDVNLVIVDFWSEGEVPRFVQEHNQALAAARQEEDAAAAAAVEGSDRELRQSLLLLPLPAE